jgi:hypothetical protein
VEYDFQKEGIRLDAVVTDKPYIDVICQHKADRSIIPIKIRLRDEDGEFQTFTIKSYKVLSAPGGHTSPDGLCGTSHTWRFLCKIVCFGMEKSVRLFYNAYENYWQIEY